MNDGALPAEEGALMEKKEGSSVIQKTARQDEMSLPCGA